MLNQPVNINQEQPHVVVTNAGPDAHLEAMSSLNKRFSSRLSPEMTDDGRIHLPGLASGLSMPQYLPLLHLYASIQEANRVLDCHRDYLGHPDHHVPHSQQPITPLQASQKVANLYYKREDLTVTSAYKVRGAVVGMAKAIEMENQDSFLAVSTGNHALGVLKAAEILRPESVRIVVPKNTAQTKLDKIEMQIDRLKQQGLQARLTYTGETFDDARVWAISQTKGEYYLDPYGDPWVVAGQGTIGLELFRQLSPMIEGHAIDEVVVVAPIGGGGLLAGTATALQMAFARDPRFQSLKIKFVGLRLSELDAFHGDAIRVKKVGVLNQALFETLAVNIVEIDDTHMTDGMRTVRDDIGVRVEGACGATRYPIDTNEAFSPQPNRLVVSILSGGNVGL